MLSKITLNDLDIDFKPRERLANFGAASLSDQELLAIILRSGGENATVLKLSEFLLNKYGGLEGLVKTSYDEFLSTKNIGRAKAASIKAACELGMRISMVKGQKRANVSSPKDVYFLLRRIVFSKQKEHLYLINLDSRKNLISYDLISVGTVNETLVHPREVYRQAIIKNATSIIVAHNHPSEDTSPSSSDIELTSRLISCGETLGIGLVDHVIVSATNYTSLRALEVCKFI